MSLATHIHFQGCIIPYMVTKVTTDKKRNFFGNFSKRIFFSLCKGLETEIIILSPLGVFFYIIIYFVLVLQSMPPYIKEILSYLKISAKRLNDISFCWKSIFTSACVNT